jgi:glycogen synthase
MRILFISNYYPPHHHGGYEELCSEIAQKIRQRGHEVYILTSNYGVKRNSKGEQNIFRMLHEEMDLRSYLSSIRFFIGRQKRLNENLAITKKTINEVQPDVLFIWGAWNIPRQLLVLSENLLNNRVVYYIADHWPSLQDANTQHFQGSGRRLVTRFPYYILGKIALFLLSKEKPVQPLKFQHCICVSKSIQDNLLKKGIPIEKAQIIYNGIDLSGINQEVQIRKHREVNQHLSLLYAGRLSPEKGVDTAIYALQILVAKGYPIHLTIVGRGTPKCIQDLLQLSKQLKVSEYITFQDYVVREEIPHLLSKHDVLLVPSKLVDAMPRIIQEGMITGIVVIGSTIGGIPEIITNEVNGLTFAPDDSCKLAQQIERLVASPNIYHSLSMAGIGTVRERFDIQRTVIEIEDYLNKVVASEK